MTKRKKNHAHDRFDIDVETAATINLLAIAWRIAADHGVCPLCLMNNAIETMDTAEKRGYIRHGIEGRAPIHGTLQ